LIKYIGRDNKTKLDYINYFLYIDLLFLIEVYYFAKGFVEECNNLDIYECKKIKVKDILRYLRYEKILIKIFGSLNKVEEFVDNIDEDGFYEFYYDLGREYFKEFYFINNGILTNIKRKQILKTISKFLYSKFSYGLFFNNYKESKNKKNLYII
jgi:hypothetical protein